MSEPESTSNSTLMDQPSLPLAAGAAPVWVDHGTADVFAIGAGGERFPIAVLSEGQAAFAPAAPIQLLVVPRLGASLTDQAPQGADTTAAQSAFVTSLNTALGTKVDPTTTDLAGDLTTTVTAAMAADNARRASLLQGSLVLTEDRFQTSLDRMTYSSQTLEDPVAAVAVSPLVAVLTIIGAREGFDVTAPATTAIQSSKDPLRLIAHISGVRYRQVALTENWPSSATSSYLAAITTNGANPVPVALLKARRGYTYQGASDPAPMPLTKEIEARLTPMAYEFYRPLTPDRVAGVIDVLRTGLRGSRGAWIIASLMALGIALLGMITPTLTNIVVGSIIPQGMSSLMIQVGGALVVAAGVAFVFSLVQSFTVSLISQRATLHMQSAFWDRVLSLPASFFRDYSSGDLTVRVLAVDSLSSLVSVQVVSSVLAAVFGLVNLFLMFSYDVMLGFAGLFVLLVTVAVLFFASRALTRYATVTLQESRHANGWLVQMLSGIMKIRIANAENRIEAQYFEVARRQTVAMSRETIVAGRMSAWFIFASSAASALFYLVVLIQWEGGTTAVSSATYLAFASAYGLVFAAISGLSGLISPIANAGPTFNLLRPIMENLPETAGGREDPGTLTGRIELRDVQFRYTADGPLVLRGLDLTIEPGTMVALVGSSGAGKSTITRLLLGFDTPESGQVLFDGRDLRDLDPTMVRSQMGVVVQNGRINRGSILKNILGGTSQDEDLAWSAAKKAAMADEIEAMPMKMQTVIDPGNISGGQAQRILLARALVHSPRILILDEATSALDNTSQAQVTQAMDDLEGTRVVIAHRLSTIMAADKIIVMDHGQAVESGTYDDLMAANGMFASLVKRQTA